MGAGVLIPSQVCSQGGPNPEGTGIDIDGARLITNCTCYRKQTFIFCALLHKFWSLSNTAQHAHPLCAPEPIEGCLGVALAPSSSSTFHFVSRPHEGVVPDTKLVVAVSQFGQNLPSTVSDLSGYCLLSCMPYRRTKEGLEIPEKRSRVGFVELESFRFWRRGGRSFACTLAWACRLPCVT